MMWNSFRSIRLLLIALGLLSTFALSFAQRDFSNVDCEEENGGTSAGPCRTKLPRETSGIEQCSEDILCAGADVGAQSKQQENVALTAEVGSLKMTKNAMKTGRDGDTSVHRMWPSFWATHHDEAEAYLNLGLTHRSILEHDPDLPLQEAKREVLRSVSAIQQAIYIYERIQRESPDETDRLIHKIASCHLDIGKTYSLSPDDAQYSRALDHYFQAEKIYRKLSTSQDGQYSKDPQSRRDTKADWAQCCLRIGAILLTTDPSQVDLHYLRKESGDYTDSMTVLQLAALAEDFFRIAEVVLSKAIDVQQDTKERIYLQRYLASTLQNLGTAAVMKSELEKGAKYSQEALLLHEEVMSKLPKGSAELDNTSIQIAEVLYNLADTYLMLGRYDASKEKYRQAMEWYERQGIADPYQPMEETEDAVDDETLHEFEEALDRYNKTFAEDAQVSGASKFRDNMDEQYDHQRYDVYEGDLRASIGSLYVAKGNMRLAESHLTEAIELYTKNGIKNDLNKADANFNMAILHFRNGEFRESADYNDEALNIYRSVVGDGKNPMEMQRVRMAEKDFSTIRKQEAPTSREIDGHDGQLSHHSEKQVEENKTKTSWEGDTIVLGTERYQRPFTNQPLPIAHVLQMWPTTWATSRDEAEAYLDLGLAHRSILELDPNLPLQLATREVVKSVNAIQQAIYVYERLGRESHGEADRAIHSIASGYLDIGKTYSLSPDDAQYVLGLDYYIGAERIYRKLLSTQDSEYLDDPRARLKAETGRAQCCLRIGAILLTMEPSEDDLQYLLQETGGYSEELVYENRTKILLQRAEDFLLTAEDVLRNAVHLEQDTKERVYLQRYLATTLQNLGTAAVVKHELEKGVIYSEEALLLHEAVISKLEKGSAELDDTIIHIGGALYNLANTYLQLGNFNKSKEKYRRAMDWYELNNIADSSLPVDEMAENDDYNGTLRAYEEALDEYNEMFTEDFQVSVGAEIYCERDNIYEGDLHASLGSIYMRKGDLIHAESHLTQAAYLYAISGAQENLNVADNKFNLAELHSRKGNFKESAAYNDQALDIYRIVVGEGENPLQIERMAIPEKDLSYIKKEHESNQASGDSYPQEARAADRDEL